MIFLRRLDQIADEEIGRYECQQVANAGTPLTFDEEERKYLRGKIKARMQEEYGSFLSMILMALLSAVIQAAIRRWLEKRRKRETWGHVDNRGGA